MLLWRVFPSDGSGRCSDYPERLEHEYHSPPIAHFKRRSQRPDRRRLGRRLGRHLGRHLGRRPERRPECRPERRPERRPDARPRHDVEQGKGLNITHNIFSKSFKKSRSRRMRHGAFPSADTERCTSCPSRSYANMSSICTRSET